MFAHNEKKTYGYKPQIISTIVDDGLAFPPCSTGYKPQIISTIVDEIGSKDTPL